MTLLKYTATERYAASALGINHNTLISRRNRGTVPYFCFQKLSCGAIRYSMIVLKRYLSDPTDTKANAVAIAHHKKAYWDSVKVSSEIGANVIKDNKNSITNTMPQEFSFTASEKDAAAAIGISRYALRDRRIAGTVPNYVFIRCGVKLIKYCIPLLVDWALDPSDTLAIERAQAIFQASRISSPHNLPENNQHEN